MSQTGPAGPWLTRQPYWLPLPAVKLDSTKPLLKQAKSTSTTGPLMHDWSPCLVVGRHLAACSGAYIVRLREAQVHKTTTGQSTRSRRADLTQSDDGDLSHIKSVHCIIQLRLDSPGLTSKCVRYRRVQQASFGWFECETGGSTRDQWRLPAATMAHTQRSYHSKQSNV